MTDERETLHVLEQTISDPHASKTAQNLQEKLAGYRPQENVSMDSSNQGYQFLDEVKNMS